jgi:hypothetical protein
MKKERNEYLVTQGHENQVYEDLTIAIANNTKFNLDSENTLILNVSPDYSSIVSQKLSHHFSSGGEIIDVLNIEVPYSDEIELSWYLERITTLLNTVKEIGYKNFVFVEAGVIRGGNYNMIQNEFLKHYKEENLLFTCLFQNIHSKFSCDCVGEFYNNETQDLTFYWERFNKHWQ